MGAPDRASDGGGGGADAAADALPRSAGSGGSVDLAWLTEQLASLGADVGNVTFRDEIEDEFEEWRDPSNGLLTSVFDACERGEAEALAPLLERLASSGWGVDTPGPDGDTALHLAALYGAEACVERLLAAGARADAVNEEDGTTPLHDAAAGGYASIVERLATAARAQLDWSGGGGGRGGGASGGGSGSGAGNARGGASGGGDDGGSALRALVNARDTDGETALHNAARGGHPACVRLLLSLGADAGVVSNEGRIPLDEADDDDVSEALRVAMAAGKSDTAQPATAVAAAAAAAADGGGAQMGG